MEGTCRSKFIVDYCKTAAIILSNCVSQICVIKIKNRHVFFLFLASTEDCIFTLSPDPKAKVYVQTPNWLEGLPPLMSVYWNISVPPKQAAQLTFLKEKMGLTCEKSRAFIYIKEQSPKAVETVFRDDNVLPKTLNMRQHFWINISNCKPSAKQQLSLQFLVTFQKNSGEIILFPNLVPYKISYKEGIILNLSFELTSPGN